MKFVYSEWNEPIEWQKGSVSSLVIENQREFRTFLRELFSASEGLTSKCVLSKDNKILEAAKRIEIVTEFVNFDINKKPLVTKIINKIESSALNGAEYQETQELMCSIENAVYRWSCDFSCDIVTTKLSVTNILKSVGVELKNDYGGDGGELEKILDYMGLVREFDCEKLFVFVNMRAYFSDNDMEKFVETAVSNEYMVLLAEANSYPLLPHEKRLTIDEDLCEF